jgi:hypothetical protein
LSHVPATVYILHLCHTRPRSCNLRPPRTCFLYHLFTTSLSLYAKANRRRSPTAFALAFHVVLVLYCVPSPAKLYTISWPSNSNVSEMT